jgi:DNA processing protein
LSRFSSSAGLRAWLAVLLAPGIGSRTFNVLLQHQETPEAILAESAESLAAIGLRPASVAGLKQPDWARIDADIAWLDQPGHHCLTVYDPAYPAQLKTIPDPPMMLFVRGNPAVLAMPQIAMVGSRNPSPGGVQLARDFARELSKVPLGVTSGLALGIDAASHLGALDGGGVTVAVVGTGVDQVYPARHSDLAAAIVAKGGAMVSEFPLQTAPQANHFPRRNRIISGLSAGTLVVEAALRSGSLITARLALEQGREVFAIPGSIQNPLSRGCNALIKQGAKLVEEVADILEELQLPAPAVSPVFSEAERGGGLDPDCRALLKCVAYDPTSVDTLIAATGSTPEAVSSRLLIDRKSVV